MLRGTLVKHIILSHLIWCVSVLHAASQQDMMYYHFAQPCLAMPTGEKIRMIQVANRIMECTDTLDAGQYLSQDQYDAFNAQLDQVEASASDVSVKNDAERRAIVLGWAANKLDGQEAARQIEALAESIQDVQDQAFTKAYAMTIYARLHETSEMKRVFDSLDPCNVPQFGWFAFETVKYYGNYVEAGVIRDAAQAGGTTVQEEYRRVLEFSEFLEKSYLPALKRYESRMESLSPLERAQFEGVFATAAQNARRYLGGRQYMDVSLRATDVIIPQLVDLWKSVLDRIPPTDGYIDKTIVQKKIDEYTTKILPRLKMLQENKQRQDMFGREMQEADNIVGKVLEAEVVDAAHESVGDAGAVDSESNDVNILSTSERRGNDAERIVAPKASVAILFSVVSLSSPCACWVSRPTTGERTESSEACDAPAVRRAL